MSKKKKEEEDYAIEVKYLEAAIDALCSDRPKDEQKYIRICGNAILNVAVKTKKKIEKMKNDSKSSVTKG